MPIKTNPITLKLEALNREHSDRCKAGVKNKTIRYFSIDGSCQIDSRALPSREGDPSFSH